MQTKQLIKVMGLALAITACGNSKKMAEGEEKPVILSDQSMMATLWLQHSAEAAVLRTQAFESAEEKLKKNLQKQKQGDMLAVIVDIDETILDNSPYMARLIKSGSNHSEEAWSSWVNEAKADLIPGAKEFLKKVESSGVEVFYISNRSTNLMGPTIETLIRYELPFADEAHIMLMNEGPDKTERRSEVQSSYKVLLLVGDQLSDFTQQTEEFSMDVPEYAMTMDSISKYFVLLPNPMYGGFEDMIYKGAQNLPDKDKDEARRRALITK